MGNNIYDRGPEILNESTGVVVECDDVDKLEAEINRIYMEQSFSEDHFPKHVKLFDQENCYTDYFEVY